MTEYGWKDFYESTYYECVKEFFEKLIRIGNEKPDCVFIFVTRSAFCLFLLLKKKGKLENWTFPIYSDRYILKQWDIEDFSEKEVILVTDTITTGNYLCDLYQKIKCKTNAKRVILQVLAIDDTIDRTDINEDRKRFFDMLDCSNEWSSNDILKFSSILTLLVYQEGIPYSIELPVLTVADPQVYFSEEDFECIKKGNVLWSYDENVQKGYLQNDMTNGILIMENHAFKTCIPEFILNMTVRVQITRVGEKISLMFIPFAILKSVKFEHLRSFFYILFEGTDYADKIRKYEEKCKQSGEDFAQKTYVALYRAVVYNLSFYIGEELKKYIKTVTGIDIQADDERNRYSFDDDFEKAVREVFESKLELSYLSDIISQDYFEKIDCRKEMKNLCAQYSSKEYTYTRAHNFMLEVINDIRHNDYFDGNEYVMRKMATIEEIEALFEYGFLYDEDKRIEDCISKCICSMLNQGELINELYYDSENRIVYRGFRWGQNSDAFCEVSAKVFYAAVLKFYKMTGERYQELYEQFLVYLFRFFIDNDLLDRLITVEEFRFYGKYFRMAGENGFRFQIENKEFIIEDRKPYYIQNVEEYIEGVSFDVGE